MTTPKKALEIYENDRFGPLLGVSDEGSAAQTIADAAYKSAKATALGNADAMCVGLIIDGERMGSAGEVPIGPDEYAQVLGAAKDRTFCSTNVGVRVNTRLHQPLPEFPIANAAADEQAWLESIFAKFYPFIHTPDGEPRPLTIRLRIDSPACISALSDLVPKIEAGRTNGRLGSPELHKLSLLLIFEDRITTRTQIGQISNAMRLAADLGIPEVAVDGDLMEAARRRISIQGLLNVLDPDIARALLGEAKELGIKLVYHYELDQESAARTIWTGLDSAMKYGLTAAKYGLFPLVMDQHQYAVNNVQRWMPDWTPVPAFYVDTALVTRDDIYEADRVVPAAKIWLDMVAKEGVKVVLVDAPDRINPHRLLKTDGGPNDPGVLTMADVKELLTQAEAQGIKVLWSGGIKPDQAYELAKLGVAGIFTTGSTARTVAVHGSLETDAQLPFAKEPTDAGVRRIHGLVQAGFLCKVLAGTAPELVTQIDAGAQALTDANIKGDALVEAIEALNATMIEAWKVHWEKLG